MRLSMLDFTAALDKRQTLQSRATRIAKSFETRIGLCEDLLRAGLAEQAHAIIRVTDVDDVPHTHYKTYWWCRAKALLLTGRFLDVCGLISQLEADGSPGMPLELRSRLLVRVGAWALHNAGRVHEADQLIARIQEDNPPGAQTIGLAADLAHYQAYRAYGRERNVSEAKAKIETAIALYRDLAESDYLVQCLVLRSVILKSGGFLPDAIAVATEAVHLASDSGNLLALQDGLRQLTIGYYRCGDYESAETCIEQGLRLSEVARPTFVVALHLAGARIAIYRGDVERARECLERAEAAMNGAPKRFQAILHEYRGLTLLAAGNCGRAIEHFAESLAVLDDIEVVSYERAEVLIHRAEALLQLCEYAKASAEATAALASLEKPGESLERGQALRIQGVASHFMGRPREARRLFDAAETELRRVSDVHELGRLLLDRAELVSEDHEGGLGDAAEAVKIFSRIGVPSHARRARDIFAICRSRYHKKEREALVSGQIVSESIVAASPAMRSLLAECNRIAEHDGAVLIGGETGVGKEVLARAIHDCSERAEQSFVAVNCAAVPEALFEREFFGHVKGAYTGADADRPGLVERADGGSMFLDEIGEMPGTLQPKLLRLLQEGTFRRVGDVEERRADIRFLSATNQKLEQLVKKGIFREDLYYRIRWFELTVPPLRERLEDVVALTKLFVSRESARKGRTYWLERSAWRLVREYSWPGNVRELEAVICSSIARADDDGCVRMEFLPAFLRKRRSRVSMDSLDLARQLRARERELILEALKRAEFQRTRAAAFLGISRNSLYDKMKRLGIDPEVSSASR